MIAIKQTVRFLILSLGALTGGAVAQTVNTVLTIDTSPQPEPYAVAVDFSNNYYLTVSAEHRIAKFNPNNGVLTNFSGLRGVFGLRNGAASVALFFNPQGILYVPGRNGFVVADSGNRLLRFVASDGSVTTLAGTGVAGTNDNSNALFAQFTSPTGLAADAAGNIYITDLGYNALRMLDTSGGVTTIATGFDQPVAVAVDSGGRIFVTSTRSHSIHVLDPITHATIAILGGDSSFLSGNDDNVDGRTAHFNSPRGLLWVGGDTGLVVSDSGNSRLRRLFPNPAFPGLYSVETLAETISANFTTPVGLALDLNRNILIVDLDRHELRSLALAPTVQQPPVKDPVIGTVTLTNDVFLGTHLTGVTNATFNNDVVVAILAEPGTQTYYIKGPSEFMGSNVVPGPNDSVADPYQDGMSNLPANILNPILPDITIKAISTQTDRRPSAMVTARFRFQVANPVIVGNNAASFSLRTATEGADLWYSKDGSDPTNTAPSLQYNFGTQLNVAVKDQNVTFKVRGFKKGYSPSQIIRQVFLTNDVQFNTIGVPRDFKAGIGSTIVIPVETQLAAGQEIRSLQFRVEISPVSAEKGTNTPSIELLPVSANDFISVNFPGANTANVIRYSFPNKLDTNAAVADSLVTNGLAIAYLGTNSTFHLLNSATVAMLAVRIPKEAQSNDVYRISVFHPTATSDGVQTPVILTTLASRTVTIVNQDYIVGDTAIARWYNAGEFGDGDLNNNDVNNTFFASLGFRVPYRFSDVFNAMDVFPEDGFDALGGDGQIRFLDWQILLRRSFRLDATNWVRSWSVNGVLQPKRGSLANAALRAADSLGSSGSGADFIAWRRPVRVGALPVENVRPGGTAAVPIYMQANPGLRVSGMQFLVFVAAEGSAPAVNQPLQFFADPAVPTPHTGNSVPDTGIVTNAVYSTWDIGTFQPALEGSNLLGQVQLKIPTNAAAGQRYTVYFANADGADQNAQGVYTQYDFESFRATVWVDAPAAFPAERLPDEWKQHFFGSLTDPTASAEADPDGDGSPNWLEYLDGTDPKTNDFHFLTPQVQWLAQGGAEVCQLSWFAATGKHYILEATSDLNGTNWNAIASGFIGTGQVTGFVHTNTLSQSQFYRVRIAPQ